MWVYDRARECNREIREFRNSDSKILFEFRKICSEFQIDKDKLDYVETE